MGVKISGAGNAGLQGVGIGPPDVWATRAIVQSTATGPLTTVSSITGNFASAQAPGNANLVFIQTVSAATISSVGDTLGNTYTLFASLVNGASTIDVYRCSRGSNSGAGILGAAAGANTVTVNFSAPAATASLVVVEANAFDFDANFTTATTANTTTSASYTTSYVAELSIGFSTGNLGTTPSPPAGWATVQSGSAATDSFIVATKYSSSISTAVSFAPTGVSSTAGTTFVSGLIPISAPATDTHTWCCFFKSASASQFGTLWQLTEATSGAGTGWEVIVDATNSRITVLGPAGATITTSAVGAFSGADLTGWWFIALTVRVVAGNSTATLFVKRAGGSTCRVGSAGVGSNQAYNPTSFVIGSEVLIQGGSGGAAPTIDNQFNGTVAGVKVWSAVLTQEALERESECVEAYRRADLLTPFDLDLAGKYTADYGQSAGMQIVPLDSTRFSTGFAPPVARYFEFPKRPHKRNVNTAVALAVAIVGTATMVDAVAVARAFAASVAGRATLGASIKVARSVSTTIAGGATVVDTLTVKRTLLASMQGDATVTDTIAVKRALADVIAADASVTSAVKLARTLADTIQGAAAFASTAKIARTLSDTIAAAAAMTDAVNVKRALADTIAGQASVVDAIKAARPLALAAVATSAVVPTIKVARPLSVTFAGDAVVTAALARLRPIADAIEGASTIADTMSVARKLTDVIGAQSTVTDSVNVMRPVAVVVAAKGTVTDAVLVARPLAVAIVGQATVTAALDVSGGVVAFAAAFVGVATTVEAVKIARAFSAPLLAEAVVVATMGAKRPLVSSVRAFAALTASLGRARPFLTTVQGSASISAAIAFGRGLTTHASGSASLAATIHRAATLNAQVRAQAFVTGFLARGAAFDLSAEGIASIVANLFYGTGPIGPMRLSAEDAAVVVYVAEASPSQVMALAMVDASTVTFALADAPTMPLVMVLHAADSATVTFTTADGPPT